MNDVDVVCHEICCLCNYAFILLLAYDIHPCSVRSGLQLRGKWHNLGVRKLNRCRLGIVRVV